MILAGTSAWVEYDRATGSPVDDRVSELVADDGPLATTELVMMEVMAGAKTEGREEDLRRLLLRFHLLALDAAADFEAVARIYRLCRRAGVTPRGLIDCMIASVARRNHLPRRTLATRRPGFPRTATFADTGSPPTAGATGVAAAVEPGPGEGSPAVGGSSTAVPSPPHRT